MNSDLTRFAFLAGCAYFVCMALAHFFGLKWPLLFIYYDTPFYAYQDKIISFAVTAYIALFWLAARSREAVPAALIVLALTVLGLMSVNLSSALAAVSEPGQSTGPYWAQTALIAVYWAVLFGLWRRDSKAVRLSALNRFEPGGQRLQDPVGLGLAENQGRGQDDVGA